MSTTQCAFALQREPCLHQSELISQRVRYVPTLTPVLGSKTPAISHGLIRETKTHY
ncbi:hypothetical protein PENSPDRAFT_659200 [Peniophora sp. CONT]|nr:hypothetical protein PENSPDRAFT_659200 [Peniophora sp. CONT]